MKGCRCSLGATRQHRAAIPSPELGRTHAILRPSVQPRYCTLGKTARRRVAGPAPVARLRFGFARTPWAALRERELVTKRRPGLVFMLAPPKAPQRLSPILSPSLATRTISTDNGLMTGNEFIRKVKALGKRREVEVRLDASRGKGSHQTLYFGSAFTIVRNPKDELKTGTFHAMCSQLGIRPTNL